VLLLSLTGCETKEQRAAHDAKIAQDARTALFAELKAKDDARLKADALQNSKLSQVGISVHDKEITINPEKAKDFFNNIGKRIEEKLRSLTKDLDKGMVEGQDTGVHIGNNNINIDLNKTQNFLNIWGKKMQNFVKEMDKMAKEMEQSKQTH
jgi:hypothetical protein